MNDNSRAFCNGASQPETQGLLAQVAGLVGEVLKGLWGKQHRETENILNSSQHIFVLHIFTFNVFSNGKVFLMSLYKKTKQNKKILLYCSINNTFVENSVRFYWRVDFIWLLIRY